MKQLRPVNLLDANKHGVGLLHIRHRQGVRLWKISVRSGQPLHTSPGAPCLVNSTELAWHVQGPELDLPGKKHIVC